MGVPATTGQLRAHIADMNVGDYIVWKVNTTTGEYEMDGSISGFTEMPLGGIAWGTSSKGYYWYGVKVDRGLIVADRVRNHSATWDAINSTKAIQGLPANILSGGTQVSGVVRSLTGGVSYTDANGNRSLTDLGFGGFPTNNEWDTYIVNFPSDKVQSGKTLDDVFHYTPCWSWCQDTIIPAIRTAEKTTDASTFRSARGRNGNLVAFLVGGSNWVAADLGFRPVFAYKGV